MATTTNYGWTTPDDTDLVKDGAAAIRTLGSSVDTTTKALNPSTTEGDLEYRSATANTNSRLAIGTAGQVLTVNSGANAPEWATPAAGGGGLELVKARTTFSNVANTSSTFDGVFTSTYRNYIIVLDNVFGATPDADLQMVMKYATNTEQTATYYWADVRARFNVTVTTSQGNNVGSYTISDVIGGSGGAGGGEVRLNAGVASESCQIRSHYSTTAYGSVDLAGGSSEVARTYTGFKLQASTGNITGAVTIYGLKVS